MLQALIPNTTRQAVSQPAPVPFPVQGWDTTSALAIMDPQRAVQLKNWFPQPGYGEARNGFDNWAWEVGTSSTSVESLMVWNGPSSQKMFAAASTAIYDVSSNAVATSAVTGLSNARWQYTNMTTAAGAFLVICNGADSVRNYNGSVWSTPSITGASSANFINVNLHKHRLWFVQSGTTSAWYLPTDAIAGAATQFDVGATFDRGGYLVATANWTRDGGAGADDFTIFISSQGQLSVYQGTDPSSATTWDLVGVFNVGTPLGRRCFTKLGADLLILTLDGVIPMSKVLGGVDQAQIKFQSLSALIANSFNQAAFSYGSNFGWQPIVYPQGTRLVVNIPTSENAAAKQYVMNTVTGAWCEFDSHNANCWAIYNNNLYFGANNGRVYKADVGPLDLFTPITCTGQAAYQAFNSPGNLKRFTMLQPMITVNSPNRPSVGISTDFVETSSLSSPSSATGAGSTWDSSTWDSSEWSSTDANVNDWTSSPALGRFASVKFQAQTGTTVSIGQWGIGTWGSATWGASSRTNEIMRINGFMTLYETGAFM
jgi:hypothetical protein